MADERSEAAVNEDELFLVDGSGYIFRAYFALPQNLTNPEGTPVGAVMGFTSMLLKLLKDLHAPNIAVIFDAAKQNFRNDIYEDYKANRPPAPEDLIPQFGLIREATEAFDIPAIEMEGFEADDLIASYARLASKSGRKVTIVGTDKDLMQLVTDNVRLYDPIKSKYIERDDVIEKFGVPPERMVDLQALAGDATDNVPGVPSIGVKTAATLLNEFGDLETLLASTDQIKQPKRRQVLEDHAEDARISQQLVRLANDVDVPVKLEDLSARDKIDEKLISFLQKQGFNTLIKRVAADTGLDIPAAAQDALANDNDTPALPPVSENKYTLINDEKTLQEWIDRAYEAGVLAIDTETTDLTPARAKLVGICLSSNIGEGAYIPVGHITAQADLLSAPAETIEQLPIAKVIEMLKPVLEDKSVLKIGQNMKYDWQILAKHGVEITPCDDTMLISYVLEGTGSGHGMDALSEKHCGHSPIKFEEVCGKGKNQITFDLVPIEKAMEYAAEDAEITLRLHHILKPRLAQEKMMEMYEEVERPLIETIARMELAGIKVNPVTLQNLSQEFGTRLIAIEKEIYELAGNEFNVGSPKQVGQILFGDMELKGGKKTKTGDWSTSASVLEKLAHEGVEIAQKILDWRQLSKLKSTYTDSLPKDIVSETGRIHTSYALTGTSTGRLASSDPNLQNIPIRTEEGRKIRSAFIPEDGYKILSVDYSQVELRLAAALAGVEKLKQAFKDGVDIHTLTASQVFDVPADEVTSELRRRAKAVNFGIIYGISQYGLAKQLDVSNQEANDFITRYLARFSEIQDYMENTKDEARKNGHVRTLFGRKCVIPDINSSNHARKQGAERQAINAPLQGTAADIMKKAMARMPAALIDAGLKARMLLQVHDELIFEVPEAELEETAALVKRVMESVVDIGVPMDAEAGWGDSWDEAH